MTSVKLTAIGILSCQANLLADFYYGKLQSVLLLDRVSSQCSAHHTLDKRPRSTLCEMDEGREVAHSGCGTQSTDADKISQCFFQYMFVY